MFYILPPVATPINGPVIPPPDVGPGVWVNSLPLMENLKRVYSLPPDGEPKKGYIRHPLMENLKKGNVCNPLDIVTI